MTRAHRIIINCLLLALPICSSLSIDMYLPAYPSIAESFTVSIGTVNLSMSIYLVGLAIGQLIYGPLTDRFGRRNVLLAGISLFTITSMACAVAAHIEFFLTIRLAQALGACSSIVICRAIIADLYSPEQRGRMMALVSAANIFSPALAPIFGGMMVSYLSWRMIFVFISAFALLMLILIIFFLPETSRYNNRDALQLNTMLRNGQRLLSNPLFLGYLAAIGLLYAAVFVWVTYSPKILITNFHINPKHFGLFFLLPALGSTSGALLTARYSYSLGERRAVRIGFGVILMAAGVLLCGELDHKLITPLFMLMPIVVTFIGIGFAQPLMISMAIGQFVDIAGFTAGIIGFIQTSCGATMGMITSSFYESDLNFMAILLFLVVLSAFIIASLGEYRYLALQRDFSGTDLLIK